MSNSILQVFGDHLRTLRIQKGLSQEKLAELAGLHRTYLGGVERGERNPTLLTLVKIARGFGVPLARLVEFDDILTDLDVHDAKSRR